MPRFMMIVKGDSEPGQLPTEEMLTAMNRYNEELAKAGVLLDLSGLHPSADGVRIKFSGGERTVINGPFEQSKELVGGYWIIQAASQDEAIEWAKRVPFETGGEYGQEAEIEIRQVYELAEFGESPAVEQARQLESQLSKPRE